MRRGSREREKWRLLGYLPPQSLRFVRLARTIGITLSAFDGGYFSRTSSSNPASNAFVCSFLGLWNHAYDCAPKAEAALKNWIEDRRAKGRVEVREPNVVGSVYDFSTFRPSVRRGH